MAKVGKNIERGQDGVKDVGVVQRAKAHQGEKGTVAHTARNKTAQKSEGRAFVTVEKGHESESGSKHEELCATASSIYRKAVTNTGASDGHGDHALQNR